MIYQIYLTDTYITDRIPANYIPKCVKNRGGEVSPRQSVAQSACQYDLTSRVSDFQNGEQSVNRRDGLKFRFYYGNTVPISWIWRFLKGFYCHRKLDLITFLELNVH